MSELQSVIEHKLEERSNGGEDGLRDALPASNDGRQEQLDGDLKHVHRVSQHGRGETDEFVDDTYILYIQLESNAMGQRCDLCRADLQGGAGLSQSSRNFGQERRDKALQRP